MNRWSSRFYVPDLVEDSAICSQCSGSGEGLHDGTLCSVCKGSGEVRISRAARENCESVRADLLNDERVLDRGN